MYNEFFKNKKPDVKKLISYGFEKKQAYKKNFDIMKGEFTLTVIVEKDNKVKTELVETSTNETYTLHLAEGVKGAFVGQIKEEYLKILKEIADNCFDYDVFVERDTLDIINYAKKKYNDYPEYLWEKFPRNAVLRRKDNKKWYAAILTVKRCKIGLDGEEIAEVLDIRAPKDKIETLLKNENIHPAYHMNKKSWITIVLDGSMSLKEICKMIDISYELALK